MRRGSLRLGQMFGVGVYVHWTFALLVGYVLLVSPASLALVFAAFGCVLLHEFGHVLAARRYGIGTHDVTMLPIGGVARLERLPDDPRQELVVALAGPAVNVAIAALLSLVFFVAFGILPGFGAAVPGGAALTLMQLIAVNLVLVIFNLLPAFPMDGGRVFRALLALRKGMLPATEIAVKVGKFCALLMAVAAFFWNPFLLLIAGFVVLAGQAELMHTRARFAPPPANSVEEFLRRAMGAFAVRDGFVYREGSPGGGGTEEGRREPKPVRGRVVD